MTSEMELNNDKIPCATKDIETIINKTAALSSAGTWALTFWHNNSPTTVSCSQQHTARFPWKNNYIRSSSWTQLLV